MTTQKNKKALFITHKKSLNLNSTISGGVQYCSREFYDVLSAADFDIKPYYVEYTRRIIDRVLIKIELAIYRMFDVKTDASNLKEEIRSNNVTYVFLNMAGTLKYSKILREEFSDQLKIYLLSHGNDSGDFLHEIESPKKAESRLKKAVKKVRLGNLLSFESLYRKKYLDGVFCVSEVEKNIESWIGSKKSFFLPRIINKNLKVNHDPIANQVGFVGRLDHGPNIISLKMLLSELSKLELGDLRVKVVGAPSAWGKSLEEEFSFVSYLGELSDEDLVSEVATWSLFLNPVFWYSTGVTTKLAKSIEWELPTISTLQGTRGYSWKEGKLIIADDSQDMAFKIVEYINNRSQHAFYKKEIVKIKGSSPSVQDVANELKKFNV